MKTAFREDEVIRFMTRAPKVHMMEIIGVNDFTPEEIELEEYVGRIDSVIGEDEALLATTLSPVDGFRCIFHWRSQFLRRQGCGGIVHSPWARERAQDPRYRNAVQTDGKVRR